MSLQPVRQALARLLGIPGADATALRAARWVVIDCETSGLDASRDRLLSVGAVAVRGGAIVLAESFGALVRQQSPSNAENILVHGIGGDAQRSGVPAAQALAGLADFVGDGVAVAFHAPFDAEVLRRAYSLARLAGAPRRWLDLARLAPALFPAQSAALRSLDDWLGKFGIDPGRRHDALGDALATAQLLLVLLAQAERQGCRNVRDLRRLERSGRWAGAA